jgi:pimeloyl-ACP methyl ester carboxylesterase
MMSMINVAYKTVKCVSPVGLHQMAYQEWGAPDNPNVLICVHGLTRVSGDFDALARVLSTDYRVVCPDIVGRGRSDWLQDPSYYTIAQYVNDLVTLIARLNVDHVDYIGTSMGGLIGICLASFSGSPIRQLVLNDIGPGMQFSAIKRIGEYIAQSQTFKTFEEAVQFIRMISAPFGPHTDAQWEKIAADVLTKDRQDQWVRNYDLGLAVPYQGMSEQDVKQNESRLWSMYDAITCPTLLIRGQNSDLLSADVAQAMTQRGPRATLIELAGVGHAPTLVHEHHITPIRQFLLGR